jgi:hypothetical protein
MFLETIFQKYFVKLLLLLLIAERLNGLFGAFLFQRRIRLKIRVPKLDVAINKKE